MLSVAGSVISDDPAHLVRSGINFIYACVTGSSIDCSSASTMKHRTSVFGCEALLDPWV